MKNLFIFYILSYGTISYADNSIIFTEINGKKISLQQLHGKWIMINYWASWCQPCIDEILSIKAQKYLIKHVSIKYPSLRDEPAILQKVGDLIGVPATLVFNPQGKLVKILYGSQTEASL